MLGRRRLIEKKDKRGDVTDIILWVVVITILALGLFILSYTTTEISDKLKDAGLATKPRKKLSNARVP